MGGRVCWASGLLVLLLACGTARVPVPTSDHPLTACRISCGPEGWFIRHQHICRGGKRYFEQMLVIARDTQRGVDGTVQSDVYVIGQPGWREGHAVMVEVGSYPCDEVALGSCDSVIHQIMSARETETGVKTGAHPGTDELGRPKP